MLITLKNILKMAESKDMAIAAFNVTSLEGVLAVIEAAEDEDTPVILQFANIAHGCNSIRATKTAIGMADIALTEAGFGADLGAEKFFDIKCRVGDLKPDAVVLVSTINSIKYNA